MIFQYKQDSSERKRAAFSMKKRIDRMFKFLV